MTRYICILDFEANCDENMASKNMDNEVIEFPSVLYKVEGTTATFISEFQLYCKPKNTPMLTPFCIELTKITQDKIDAGVPFSEAMTRHLLWLQDSIPDFEKNVSSGRVIITTCGNWDLNTMAPKEYANYNIVPHRVYLKFINIKVAFGAFHKTSQQRGMVGMLDHLGIRLRGTHHSGIDDCRNISKIVVRMIEDGWKMEKAKMKQVRL